MAQNTEGENEVKTTSKFDEKVETVIESFGKDVANFADKIGKKIDHLDEEDIEKFFVRVGNGIVAFFTVVLPRFIKKTVTFFCAVWQKINKLIKSNRWGFIAPLLFILIGLIVLVAIASGIRGLFS